MKLPVQLLAIFNMYRPRLHFTSTENWINGFFSITTDPCGFTFYNGEYHLSYQHHPDGTQWATPILWGYATSTNLLDWDIKEPILNVSLNQQKPGNSYDNVAVFSGSVINSGFQGLPTLFYTGVTSKKIHYTLPYEMGQETKAIAVSRDGMKSWEKLSDINPVIAEPHEKNLTGWRDPLVFKSQSLDKVYNETNSWYMIVGGGRKRKGGAIFLYRSLDLINWTPCNDLLTSSPSLEQQEFLGFNWERPDFFELPVENSSETLAVLIFGTEGAVKNHDEHITLYYIGKINERGSFAAISSGILDYGNLYATTSFEKDNQRIMIGWSNEMTSASIEREWAGAFSIPTILSIEKQDSKFVLKRKPIDLSSKMKSCAEYANLRLPATLNLQQCSTKTLDVEFQVTIHDDFEFELALSTQQTLVKYSTIKKMIEISNSGTNEYAPVSPSEKLHVRVLLDGSIIEVFVNSQTVITSRVYSNEDQVDFKSTSGAFLDYFHVRKYD